MHCLVLGICSEQITAQVYRLQAGQHLASVAIRRLRQLRQRELGAAPAVIYLAGCYGVFALEEVLSLLETPARESLLPIGARPLLQMLPPNPYLQMSGFVSRIYSFEEEYSIIRHWG
jgi:hypothetical protein